MEQDTRKSLTYAAQHGFRVILLGEPGEKNKTLWEGLGKRAGIHSFTIGLLSTLWEESGARFEKQIDALPEGATVEIHAYRAINRDRGRWVRIDYYDIG